MSHKVISSIIALAFLVLIQVYSDVFRYLFYAMTAYIVVFMVYNLIYLKRNNLFSFWSWIRPLFFVLAAIGLYFIIPNNMFQGFFLVITTAILFLLELRILVPSEQILFLETLLSYFALVLTIFTNQFYFLPKNSVTLILLGIVTFFLARSSFEYLPQTNGQKHFYAWFLAFCMLEVSWAAVFLPFHPTVMAVILLNVFYVLWIVFYYHMLHNLTVKKISFHIIFSTILIILTLLSTPWKAV
jgi:hypothetical protein